MITFYIIKKEKEVFMNKINMELNKEEAVLVKDALVAFLEGMDEPELEGEKKAVKELIAKLEKELTKK
jgi:hypothetical protein